MTDKSREEPGGWESFGGWSYRLVMKDPNVRLCARNSAHDGGVSWDATAGWPGVCAMMRSGVADDAVSARRAAEDAAYELVRGICHRASQALTMLGRHAETRSADRPDAQS